MRANEKEREKEGEKVQQVKLSDSVFPRVEDLQGTVKNPPASGGEDSKPRKLIDDSDTSRRRERDTVVKQPFHLNSIIRVRPPRRGCRGTSGIGVTCRKSDSILKYSG